MNVLDFWFAISLAWIVVLISALGWIALAV
jgi:hypothetical protein